MANVGTQEDRDHRRIVADTEPEWKSIGPPISPGVHIWRVENEKASRGKAAKFGVKSWPDDRYGELYLGDSYIVLNSVKVTALQFHKHPTNPTLTLI